MQSYEFIFQISFDFTSFFCEEEKLTNFPIEIREFFCPSKIIPIYFYFRITNRLLSWNNKCISNRPLHKNTQLRLA